MDDELQFFQAWWKILRKYWNPPTKSDKSKQADEFWDALLDECRDLHGKYNNNKLFHPFALKMCLELINEVQRRSVELHKEVR